ncbi:hypothetical protein GCM10018782_14930 [Streptomyces griseoaurantiacus]|nr:hypothetical protein GCM10018782_14930 [Streptomyces griseoaurantiacus]
MRAETRRSVGGVAALMHPSFQTGKNPGTRVSRTEHGKAPARTPVRMRPARGTGHEGARRAPITVRALPVRRPAADHVHSYVVGL